MPVRPTARSMTAYACAKSANKLADSSIGAAVKYNITPDSVKKTTVMRTLLSRLLQLGLIWRTCN